MTADIKSSGSDLRVPGSQGYRGDGQNFEPTNTLWRWRETNYSVTRSPESEALIEAIASPEVAWLSQIGIHKTEVIRDLGTRLALHPLTVEDLLNTESRPKVERYDGYTLLVFKGLWWKDGQLDYEHVAITYSPAIVATFQELEDDVFAPIRLRIERAAGRVRERGTEYLVFALLDTVVDGYLDVVERIGLDVEALEADRNRIARDPNVPEQLHRYKTQTNLVRQFVLPLRDGIKGLLAEENGVDASNQPFFRDLLDHLNQVLDTASALKESLAGLLGLHLSLVSQATNEDMRVLTVIATVFIPLTFIAGIYGMNFENMPELEWRWGYPALWGIMLLIGGALALYFRRRRWL